MAPRARLAGLGWLGFVALLVSCGGDSTKPKGPDDGNLVEAEITSVTSHGGKQYALLETPGIAILDTLELREEGKQLDLWVATPENDPNPAIAWISRVSARSRPWTVADYGAGVSDEWTIVEADTVFVEGGVTYDVSVVATGTALGPSRVTVPAGTFEDTYRGRLTQSAEVVASVLGVPVHASIHATMEFHLKPGVGLVRREVHETIVQPGQATQVISEIGELHSYTLTAPPESGFPLRLGNRWKYRVTTTQSRAAAQEGGSVTAAAVRLPIR